MTNLLLSAAKTLILTPGLSLVTWATSQPAVQPGLTAYTTVNAAASCTLELTAGRPALTLAGTEPKQDGYVYSFTPSAPISATIVQATDEVTTQKGWCNGEPELCDNTVYNVALSTVVAQDEAGNQFTLRCYGDSSTSTPAKVKASDVRIQGLSVGATVQ